jgi:hypothetical protein
VSAGKLEMAVGIVGRDLDRAVQRDDGDIVQAQLQLGESL